MENSSSQWKAFRRNERRFLYAIIILLFGASLIPLAAWSNIGWLGAIAFVMADIGIAACLWTWYKYYSVRCPRCGKLFFISLYAGLPIVRKCRHCGVRKYTYFELESGSLTPKP